MIFVQMAAYRDPQLLPTIEDLILNADKPEELRIVVCRQFDVTKESLPVIIRNTKFTITEMTGSTAKLRYDNSLALIEFLEVDHFKSKGACWARHFIQQQYNKEQYTLQLDSHHRFEKHWDTLCIDMLEGLRYKSPKPVLTAYLPSFDPEKDPVARVRKPWRMNFDRFTPEGVVFFMPSTIDDYKKLKEPIPARFYSAHFCFADGSFAEEVQHDPEYFFHGEEISITVRAFTHGYDLYHPHRLVAYHEYTRKNRTKIWDDHVDSAKTLKKIEKNWVEVNNESLKLNRILFGMDGEDPNQVDFGKYGFGNARTVREYEAYAGLCFRKRSIQQQVLDKIDPTLEYTILPDDEWFTSLVRSNDIKVCIHKNELGKIEPDYDFWYLGCHDENGKEIHRKDLVGMEIKNHLLTDWIDFRYIFTSNYIPVTYTLWTHSASKGWLEKITKNV